jgi:hypothetical protein
MQKTAVNRPYFLAGVSDTLTSCHWATLLHVGTIFGKLVKSISCHSCIFTRLKKKICFMWRNCVGRTTRTGKLLLTNLTRTFSRRFNLASHRQRQNCQLREAKLLCSWSCIMTNVSARMLTPCPAVFNHCRNCTPASEDGLKQGSSTFQIVRATLTLWCRNFFLHFSTPCI